MRPGGGKGKGGGYERKVGEKLSLWISQGIRKDLLCRTVGSGAQFTTAAKKLISAGHAGDLMSQDLLSQEFCSKFVIECKFWKNLEIIKFLDKKGELFDALKKVQKEAKDVNKKYWLVAKQNQQKDLLFMERQIITGALPPNVLPMYHQLFCGEVVMWYLDEFLSLVNPAQYLLI
jgi:hypothetical protein